MLADGLPGTAAAAAALPAPAVYRGSSSSTAMTNGSADLAMALQQLKLVPDRPAVVVSGPAAPNALTAGMMFEFQSNIPNSYTTGFPTQQMCSSNGLTGMGLAGELQLLQPMQPSAAAANALLLQQQREQLQQQQLLLAQQEQMLLQQQMQIMNLGLGGQQILLFSN